MLREKVWKISKKPSGLEKDLSDKEYDSARENEIIVNEDSQASLQPKQIDITESPSSEEMIRKVDRIGNQGGIRNECSSSTSHGIMVAGAGENEQNFSAWVGSNMFIGEE